VHTKSHTIAFWAILAAVFFLPFLGAAHLFDWDEINFAEVAREMVVLQNYLEVHMNFAPFTEKPPLFFWLQAASMKIFGVGDYAARFPNAVLGILVFRCFLKWAKPCTAAASGFTGRLHISVPFCHTFILNQEL